MADNIVWKRVRHFQSIEFNDPNHPGSGIWINGILLMRLDVLRHDTNWPIIPHAAVGGCVDMEGTHEHSTNSYHLKSNGCKACDFHFITDASPRRQYYEVSRMGFGGLGAYYDWNWKGRKLLIGFHVDVRPSDKTQRWKRIDGQYIYLLN